MLNNTISKNSLNNTVMNKPVTELSAPGNLRYELVLSLVEKPDK